MQKGFTKCIAFLQSVNVIAGCIQFAVLLTAQRTTEQQCREQLSNSAENNSATVQRTTEQQCREQLSNSAENNSATVQRTTVQQCREKQCNSAENNSATVQRNITVQRNTLCKTKLIFMVRNITFEGQCYQSVEALARLISSSKTAEVLALEREGVNKTTGNVGWLWDFLKAY